MPTQKSTADSAQSSLDCGKSVLIVDDDPAIRLVLRRSLEGAGYEIEEAVDSQSALAELRTNRFCAALLDIMIPGVGGLEVLSTARSEGLPTPIVVITAASTMTNAVEAMKRGAHDYLTKPFANLDLVNLAVARAAEFGAQSTDIDRPRQEIGRTLVGGEIVGRSNAMQELYKLIGRLVNNDANVLLFGESGTGKELIARAIHFKSDRWRASFVAVNCSAIPQGLLESELFGHERGAFTGAIERRAGKFEAAGAGTIFLDEIGDMSIELQPKLLRALQEREFTRVGGSETVRLQARVIAATNQDLEAAVAARRFREDLFFRLKVIPINLPPLRARREDIPELTDYFLAKAAREAGSRAILVSPEARALLLEHSWPGNVRELENCVLRAALLAPGNTIRAEDIVLGASTTLTPASAGASMNDSLADLIERQISKMLDEQGNREDGELYLKILSELERPLIAMTLERAGGNQVRAARILGLNRNTLRKKIFELGIVVPRRSAES